jgi:hypothetical protein
MYISFKGKEMLEAFFLHANQIDEWLFPVIPMQSAATDSYHPVAALIPVFNYPGLPLM